MPCTATRVRSPHAIWCSPCPHRARRPRSAPSPGCCAERDIPVIAMTGAEESTLAQLATYTLDTMVLREADPLNLAPTASTTAALVMGDALACALVVLREFTHHDFAQFHPSGALGRKLCLGRRRERYDVCVLGSFMKDLVASAERRPLPGRLCMGPGLRSSLAARASTRRSRRLGWGRGRRSWGRSATTGTARSSWSCSKADGVDTEWVIRHPAARDRCRVAAGAAGWGQLDHHRVAGERGDHAGGHRGGGRRADGERSTECSARTPGRGEPGCPPARLGRGGDDDPHARRRSGRSTPRSASSSTSWYRTRWRRPR